MDDESITLDCPLCAQTHQYRLRIGRMTIRYMNGKYGPWYDKEFTRVFVCPVKSDKFEATLVLSESRENLITTIDADVVPTATPAANRDA